ncbi:hypothetical protein WJX81_003314 [Elliptochloris bilobata]|uniref:SET domain-containing protein n=1 Tax=Elliptochloris bilobata TaxID=381761 RepID=A0AAW1RLK7_9CHLO
MGLAAAGLYVALVCLPFTAAPLGSGLIEDAQAVIPWVVSLGGQAKVKIGTNSAGIRAALATRSLKAGEVVVHVPANLTITLATVSDHTLAENARLLAHWRAKNRGWWDERAPFWRSLPPPGSVWRELTLTDDQLRLLQDERLAAFAREQRDEAEAVYYGTAQLAYPLRALKQELPGTDVTLPVFKHLAAVIGSYCWYSPRRNSTGLSRVLVPLMDMVNHRGVGHNMRVDENDDGSITARALRDIAAGEEVTHLYGWEMERPDRALFRSGFVAPTAMPPLCGIDYPGGDPDTFVYEPELGHGPGEPLATRGELARLQAVLAGFPTTEAQDAKILAGKKLAARHRLIIEFRRMRKRGLRLAVARLRALLDEADADHARLAEHHSVRAP